MAKKKTVKSAPVKSAGNSEHDYTFKTENMGAYRFDKDCYVSLKVNRTSLDVALGAIIDGETYTTTANLTGGSGGDSTTIRYTANGSEAGSISAFNQLAPYVPNKNNLTFLYNDEEKEITWNATTNEVSGALIGYISFDENFLTDCGLQANEDVLEINDGDVFTFIFS